MPRTIVLTTKGKGIHCAQAVLKSQDWGFGGPFYLSSSYRRLLEYQGPIGWQQGGFLVTDVSEGHKQPIQQGNRAGKNPSVVVRSPLVKDFITRQNFGSDPQFCECNRLMVALVEDGLQGGQDASNHLPSKIANICWVLTLYVLVYLIPTNRLRTRILTGSKSHT